MGRRTPILLVSDFHLPEPLTPASLESPSASFLHLAADRYLEGDELSLAEGTLVVNLCRSYGYLSRGYYSFPHRRGASPWGTSPPTW